MIVQLVVAAGNRAGQEIPVPVEKFTIGRAADCHLRPASELVSRYHCALLVSDGVVVRDLGSRNGVRINGEKINAEQKVNNGDRLAVGPLEFFVKITDGDAPAELPAGGMNSDWIQHSDQTDSFEVHPSHLTVAIEGSDSLQQK
ncbi:MAG: FHA domain-containing protein [Planctomycetaceae bacterium]|jgi:pSer/pThr/pTyr-binding forkhead associated (FHA) protein|nr:FHA domain-containing protein [Planctomycetaceae bacterium]